MKPPTKEEQTTIDKMVASTVKKVRNTKKARPLETSVTDSILKYLNGLDRCRAQKKHGTGMGFKGEPDVSGCYHGRCFKVEVKVWPNKPTDLQKDRLDAWAAAGAVCIVAYSVDDVKKMIEGMETC